LSEATSGNTVRIHYTGRLDDGTVFDSSEGREPLSFTLGEGKVIPGFEAAVVGMGAGDTKSAVIPAEEAYGPRRDDLVLRVERERLPEGIDPEPGQALQMQTEEGQVVPVTVTEVDEAAVILDANHPLAGRDLTFEIEVVEVG
jgi:peptidylprolyl isomerase